MNSALPLERLLETNKVQAFFHPQPSYPFHVIIIPKYEIQDLLSLDIHDSELLQDIFKVAQTIVKNYRLESYGYRLIVNGGSNQDFPLLHFHLIAELHPNISKEHP